MSTASMRTMRPWGGSLRCSMNLGVMRRNVACGLRDRCLGGWLLAGACAVSAAGAQPAAPSENALAERPRIGLVLSGGGARGGAHLGVLKVLEELRVPVDIVVGTSAGSIIGAAYASGMPLAQIEAELRPLKTSLLFRDVDRADLPLRRKAEEVINYIGPEIGINDQGLALPKAAVAGVSLEAVLRRLTVRQRSQDFDALPIAFRAVATDLTSGEMVVLGRGSLSTAVRASMALPAIVNPVEVNGRLLVDGGVSRNLPVDVARAMGAQVVIAVNISTPLLGRDDLTSALSVSQQMVGLLTASNINESLRSLQPQDVLISPQLGDIGTADFDRLLEAAKSGENAARAAAVRLARYRVDGPRYAAYESNRTVVPPPSGVVDEVRVSGAARVNPEVVRQAMGARAGQPLDAAVIEGDMKRLYATGDFEHVSYRIDDLPGNRRALVADVVEKSWGPHYLRLGLGLSSDFKGNSTFDLLINHRRTWLNTLGAEWRNTLQFGHVNLLGTEWHQPLETRQRLFVSAHAQARREPFDVYLNDQRLSRYRRQQEALGADVGLDLGGVAELRAGLMRGQVRLETDTGIVSGNSLIPTTDIAGLHLRLRVDTLDSLRFPREGLALDARYFRSQRALGAAVPYEKIDVSMLGALSLGAHALSLGAMAQHGVGDRDLPGWELAQLGGFLRLSGFRTNQLLGTGMRLGRVVYTYRLATPGLLDGAYVGASAEVGRISEGIGSPGVDGTLRSNALFLAADTPLGPVYVGVGFAAGGRRIGYVYLGFP
jgi:NTE family protein